MGKKLTNEEIDKRIEELVGDEYIRLEEYKGSNIKILIKHNTCGNEYRVKWNHFQQGKRCPRCSKNANLTNEEVEKRLLKFKNGEYVIFGKYKNMVSKTSFKHLACDNIYETSLNNLLRSECPFCSASKKSKRFKFTNNRIDNEIRKISKDEYVRLSDYNGANSKFLMKHNICGNKYEVTWGIFQQGGRCPKCNESKGEKKISNLLKSLNIKYTSQKRFKDCKYKKTLPFDFYINNKQSKLLIEFDGMQHYKSIDYFGGDESLKLTKLRDSIKNKFAQDNKIPLLRISYLDEEDVENIVMNKLKELNFIK